MSRSHRSSSAIRSSLLFAMTSIVAVPSTAWAGGMTTHLWQTEEAVKALQIPALKTLMTEHEEAWMRGSSYPDSGFGLSGIDSTNYPGAHDWGEHAHWGPFQKAYFDKLVETCQGQYETNWECGNTVAHFMGTVAHSAEDQIWDELFLPKVQAMCGVDQYVADPGLDFTTLVRVPERRDRYPRGSWVSPNPFFMTDAYWRSGVSVGLVEHTLAVGIMAAAHLAERAAALPAFYFHYWPRLEWATNHMVDDPGGIMWSGLAVARIMERLWERLHARDYSSPPTHYPAANQQEVPPHRLLDDSRVVIAFDRRIVPSSLRVEDTAYVLNAAGQKLAGQWKAIYADANNDNPDLADRNKAMGHVAAFYPSTNLAEDAEHMVVLTDGILDEAGAAVLPNGHSWTFKTRREEPVLLAAGGLCLEGAATSGSAATMQTCDPTRPAQHWFVDASTGRIQMASSTTDLCLDVDGSLAVLGRGVLVYNCHGGLNQRWHVVQYPSTGVIRSGLGANMVLDASAPVTVGKQAVIWTEHGQSQQQWEVRLVHPPPPPLSDFDPPPALDLSSGALMQDHRAVFSGQRGQLESFAEEDRALVFRFFNQGWMEDRQSFAATPVAGRVAATYSASRGHSEVFFRGEDGFLQHYYVEGGSWHHESAAFQDASLGPVSGIAAAYDESLQSSTVVFVGDDARLHLYRLVGGAWEHTLLPGGDVTGAVAAVYDAQRQSVGVFAQGIDGYLQYIYRDGQGTWIADTTSLRHARVGGAIAAVYEPQRQHPAVFFASEDRVVHYDYVSGGSWHHDGSSFENDEIVGDLQAVFASQRNHSEIAFVGADATPVYYFVDNGVWTRSTPGLFAPAVRGGLGMIWSPAEQHTQLDYRGFDGLLHHYHVPQGDWVHESW
jgi:hypothetical protein